jgi:NADPH:quinone reductase-like Zn-dependent oxidoreductase
MKAWAIDTYGGPEKLTCRSVPEPNCGPRDLKIQVKAVGLNPVDWKIREGELSRVLSLDFPLVLGSELSGVVESVGSEVQTFSPGDEIFARVGKERMGTLAEKFVVSESLAALKPKGLSHQDAAGLPLAGLTAWQALHDLARVKAGDRVLIHAGAGGVGTLAIQMAKLAGAQVATTASAPKHRLLRELGADQVIDYQNERFEDVLEGCDVILDTVGGETQDRSVDLLREGGTLVSVVGPLDPQTALDLQMNWIVRRAVRFMSWSIRRRCRQKGASYRFHFMRADGRQLAHLAALVESESLKPVTDRSFSFEETAEAFAYAEKGHATGKVIVELD